MYDLAHVTGNEPQNLHDVAHCPGLGVYYADPAQHLRTAGEASTKDHPDLRDVCSRVIKNKSV